MTTADDRLEELSQLLEREADTGGPDDWEEIYSYLDTLGLISCMNGAVRDPIGLFWGLKTPSYRYKTDAPQLSEEIEEVVLKSLERLYQYHKDKVTYEPDGDVISEDDFQESLESGHIIIPEKLKDLMTFLHVAAARAFRIKQNQGGGWDEDSLTCLEETARTFERIESLNRRGMGIDMILYQDPSQTFLLSTHTVGGIALFELGLNRYRKESYADALRYMAEAMYQTSYAAVRYVDGEPYAAKIGTDSLPLATTIPLKDCLVESLDHISLPVIVRTFFWLKADGELDSWSQVARDCNRLTNAFMLFEGFDFDWPSTDPIEETFDEVENFAESLHTLYRSLDDETRGVPWEQFWSEAGGWARAQLSRSQLMKLRAEEKQEEENSASERRLKNYFFRRDWSELPERSKVRLVNADINWNRPVQVALEAILSDLRIATEDICYKFIWEPLSGSKDSQDFTQSVLEKEDGRVRERPEIGDYAYVCFSSHFKSFLEKQKLHRKDRDFLTKNLPEAMDNLRKARNIAEHESKTWTRDEVGRHFLLFIGIGQRGILPGLADIGRKLRKV